MSLEQSRDPFLVLPTVPLAGAMARSIYLEREMFPAHRFDKTQSPLGLVPLGFKTGGLAIDELGIAEVGLVGQPDCGVAVAPAPERAASASMISDQPLLIRWIP
ncbi:MAG: hypothetical protein OET79_13490, partial [Nitrospirota bacterium]|nr:hypothetical protein [Nitrospirota bacterium]